MKLLEIQSSARKEGSISRTLSDEFVTKWKTSNTEHQKRDVGINPPAHPTALWTKATYTSPEQRSPEMEEVLAESETLIEELFWADYLLLGAPIYNFSIPSTLKAYLDNVVRVNRTFIIDATNYTFQGLLTTKKALIITPSAGNYVMGTPLGHMNFCDTYLRFILRFIGIEEISVVPVPNQFMSAEIRQQEIETAKTKLMNLAHEW